jgi:hypothetical protein
VPNISGINMFTDTDLIFYPFLSTVWKRVNINEIFRKPEHAIIDYAYNRIIDVYNYNTPYIDWIDNREREIIIASFPTAIILLSLAKNKILTKHFALFESKRSLLLLIKEDTRKIVKIAEDIGIKEHPIPPNINTKIHNIKTKTFYNRDDTITDSITIYLVNIRRRAQKLIEELAEKDYNVDTTHIMNHVEKLRELKEPGKYVKERYSLLHELFPD